MLQPASLSSSLDQMAHSPLIHGFLTIFGGKIKHDIFDDDGLDVLDRAVPELHALMKEHTGGS